MLAVFGRIDPALRKSVTFDNDTAFAKHALLRSMRNMTTWFCDAYASWQKGGVENANGRLRRWLPRHLDMDQRSDEELQDIVMTANLTPRKCLGFLTPFPRYTTLLRAVELWGAVQADGPGRLAGDEEPPPVNGLVVCREESFSQQIKANPEDRLSTAFVGLDDDRPVFRLPFTGRVGERKGY